MSSIDLVAFWAANFTQVALLGFQTRNVNGGHYARAAVTSAAIAASQILMIRGAIEMDFWAAWAIIASSGAAGVVFGMFLWVKTIRRAP